MWPYLYLYVSSSLIDFFSAVAPAFFPSYNRSYSSSCELNKGNLFGKRKYYIPYIFTAAPPVYIMH